MSATSNNGYPWAVIGGEPAFGHGNHEQGGAPGLTKREYFAGQALAGMLANQEYTGIAVDSFVSRAVQLSGALLSALEAEL